MGNDQRAAGRHAEAADAYSSALALRPDYFDAAHNLASAFEAQVALLPVTCRYLSLLVASSFEAQVVLFIAAQQDIEVFDYNTQYIDIEVFNSNTQYIDKEVCPRAFGAQVCLPILTESRYARYALGNI